MEKFMESQFMQGFMVVAAKIGAQKHLVAIRDGFVAMMPIVIAGSLTVVVLNLPINKDGDGFRTILDNSEFGLRIIGLMGGAWWGTLGVLAVFLVVGAAYGLARAYEQDAIACALTALSVFLACTPETTTGYATEDKVIGAALMTKILNEEEIEGFTVETVMSEDPIRTDEGSEIRIAGYKVSSPTIVDDTTKEPIVETITVNYNNTYKTDDEGNNVLRKDENGKFIAGEYEIDSTTKSYSVKKETSAWGNIQSGTINSNGLFVAMIIGLLCGEVFSRLSMSNKVTIKMPESVPPAVATSFSSLFPAMITLFVVLFAIQLLIYFTDYPSFFALVTDVISEPLKNISEGYGAAVIVGCATTFLWFFGLHGANIVGAVFEPISLPKLTENSDLINAGEDPVNIVTTGFFNTYIWMGGSGCTLALLFAVYIASKSKAQKAVANLAIVPGMFEINEPVIFGLPIVLNPAYFIPFILVPFVLVTITYFATTAGFAPIVGVLVPWTMPPIISGLIGTSSVMSCVMQVINLVIATLIYLPFVKIADRMEEKAQEA